MTMSIASKQVQMLIAYWLNDLINFGSEGVVICPLPGFENELQSVCFSCFIKFECFDYEF